MVVIDGEFFVEANNHEAARFWSKVKWQSGDGCWEWFGGSTPKGYGVFFNKHKRLIGSHRHSWTAIHGDAPRWMSVCHKCDNPKCVRPDHLFLGTMKENIRDCVQKGRKNQAAGERHGFSKLKERDVIEMCEMSQRGATTREIADRFGIVPRTAWGIVTGKTWKHVDRSVIKGV